jgi:hypothetical protein
MGMFTEASFCGKPRWIYMPPYSLHSLNPYTNKKENI